VTPSPAADADNITVCRANYEGWVSSLTRDVVDRAGFKVTATDGNAKLLRQEALALGVAFHHPEFRAEALRRFEAANGDLEKINPNDRRGVLRSVVSNSSAADPSAYNTVLETFKTTSVVSLRRECLYALAYVVVIFF
jgi:hypothetical protein